MKKEILFLILGIFIIGLVFATNGNSMQGNNDEVQKQNDSELGNQIREQNKERIREGNLTIEGKKIMIKKMTQEKIRIHSGNSSVDTDLNITQEQIQNKTKLHVQLSNGKNSEVKIMPDEASERALERLRLKVCNESNNCTLELKEVGKGDQIRVAYEMQVQKQSRVFGLFKTQMKVQTQVDAENGEVVQTKKPWWAFLTSESDEIEGE